MVRHNKRHSRKKGGKRSRGRRQFGGFWRSLITANENVVYDEHGNPTRQKGIDIKHKGSGPNRLWLIGGDDKTVGELLRGAKEGRYVDVIRAIRSMRGGIPEILPDDQKGITLTDDEFCALFVRNLSTEDKPLADKYHGIRINLRSQPDFHSMCQHELPPVSSSMFNPVQRASHAYRASAPPPPPSHYNAQRAIDNGLGDSFLSGQIARGMSELGRR